MGAFSKAYLVAYNLASAVTWGAVCVITAKSLANGDSSAQLWNAIKLPLSCVQYAMVLDIGHALVGLVRSPVVITFIQVMSRVIVLAPFTGMSAACQNHVSLYSMVGAWSLVETVRYSFYLCGLIPALSGPKLPLPLFWLRYSLFYVLYPMGITSEMMQIYTGLPMWESMGMPWVARLARVLLATYVFFGPYMVMNMVSTRRRAFKSRALKAGGAPKPRPLDGLVWPITKRGDRSSTDTNKAVWSAAVRGLDAKQAESIQKERKWRFKYPKYIESNVRLSAETPENALIVAKEGLAFAQDTFRFVRDGKETSVREAMDSIKGSFETGVIAGEKAKPKGGFSVKVPYHDDVLEGEALLRKIDEWIANGTIESSAGNAIKQTAAHPEWLDLSDRYFVLLGATSAMGPIDTLLALGANIIAIDLDRPMIWKNLLERTRNSCGKLIFPMTKPQADVKDEEELVACAGANLLSKTPEIANWLSTVCPNEALTIGNYTYLDGALHVQLSLASDVIMERVCAARKDTSLAFLCTPTDTHVVPKAAHDEAKVNYAESPLWLKAIRSLAGGKVLSSNAPPPVAKSGLYIADAIINAQGPNYALAKRIQHWRAMIARSNGHVVASNVAPSTATKSVVSNASFAAAYGGFHHFKAMEVMYQETSAAVMNAILLYDLNDESSASHPKTKLSNPLELFTHGAFHGGAWRCGYKMDSIGMVAALAFYLKTYRLPLVLGLGGAASVGNYVVTGTMLPVPGDSLSFVTGKKEL